MFFLQLPEGILGQPWGKGVLMVVPGDGLEQEWSLGAESGPLSQRLVLDNRNLDTAAFEPVLPDVPGILALRSSG